jgi:hypothetical protein
MTKLELTSIMCGVFLCSLLAAFSAQGAICARESYSIKPVSAGARFYFDAGKRVQGRNEVVAFESATVSTTGSEATNEGVSDMVDPAERADSSLSGGAISQATTVESLQNNGASGADDSNDCNKHPLTLKCCEEERPPSAACCQETPTLPQCKHRRTGD